MGLKQLKLVLKDLVQMFYFCVGGIPGLALVPKVSEQPCWLYTIITLYVAAVLPTPQKVLSN